MSNLKQKRKVLITTPYYAPHTGGVERYVEELSKQLSGHFDWEVVIVTTGTKGSSDSKEVDDGKVIYRLAPSLVVSNTPLAFSWFFKVRKILKDENPDIVNVHLPVPGLSDIVARMSKGIPLVVSYHGVSMKKGNLMTRSIVGVYESFFLQFLLKRAKLITCTSDFIASSFIKDYPEKTIITTPGVDGEIFFPEPSKRAKTPTIAFVASLNKADQYKGLSLLLQAVAGIKTSIPNIKLNVVGEGNMVLEYKEQVEKLGLGENVQFLGRLSGPDLAAIYQEAWVFTLPSSNETFGIVLLEAMACGTPVVALNIPGVSTLVKNNANGLLVEPGSIEGLTATVSLLLTDKNKADNFSQAGLTTAKKSYTWKKRGELFSKNFNELLKPKKIITHLVSYYPPHHGGMEQRVKELATKTAAEGYDVRVVTTDNGGVCSKEIQAGVAVTYLKSFSLFRTPIALGLISYLFTCPKDGVIHLHVANAYFPEILFIIARLRGLKYIVHIRMLVAPSTKVGRLLLPMYNRFILKSVISGAEKVIVLTPGYVDIMKKEFGIKKDKIEVIPNATTFSLQNLRVNNISEPIKFLAVGRPEYQKNYPFMLEVMAELKNVKKLNFQLRIVGEGSQRESLENLALSLGLENEVVFVGPKLGAELEAEYESADIFIHTSFMEGFSTAFLEAMSKGLPIVASDVLGTKDVLVHEYNGLLSELSVSSFAHQVMRMVSDNNLYATISKNQSIDIQKYNWSEIVKKTTYVYDVVLAKNKIQTKADSNKLAAFLLISWVVFGFLFNFGVTSYNVLNIVGFACLLLIPGFLTILILKIEKLEAWALIGLSAGFSLLELMFVGLISNVFVPLFGVAKPLDGKVMFWILSVFTLVLFIAAYKQMATFSFSPLKSLKAVYKNSPIWPAVVPIIFVVMSILGAIRLNNGESGVLTFVMLILIALYFLVFLFFGTKASNFITGAGIYLTSLALLLMTSLRGWSITGHDIQLEFKVFQLAKNAGLWSLDVYQDAYNACLSITILPTIFDNLLAIEDPYVYKILFQLIFALVPVFIFLIVRKYASTAIAFLSVIYFLAFPTFFADMPFLNRQEIAFLFLVLMTYIIFSSEISLRVRQSIFVVLGIGMVFSHYSTTYTVIAILSFVVFVAYSLMLFRSKFFEGTFIEKIAEVLFSKELLPSTHRITITMVGILAVVSFAWSSVLTDTSSNSLYRVISSTIEVILNNAGEVTQSGDVLYSFFSWDKPDDVKLFKEYNEKVVIPTINTNDQGIYYDESVYSLYETKLVFPGDVIPPRPLGRALTHFGVDIESLNFLFKQTSAKILQLLLAIGLMAYFFRFNPLQKRFETEYVALAGGSAILVFAIVVLPILSVEYGLLRAFLQALIFLSVFIVIGSLVASRLVVKSRYQIPCATFIAVLFFVVLSGVATEALGGYGAQLHLNNAGFYYDRYYTHQGELAGYKWLSEELLPQAERGEHPIIQADSFLVDSIPELNDYQVIKTLYPPLIRNDAYVFLDETNSIKGQSTVLYKSNPLTFELPINFFDNQKELLYDNGVAKIYR